jgi:hypothetical protein
MGEYHVRALSGRPVIVAPRSLKRMDRTRAQDWDMAKNVFARSAGLEIPRNIDLPGLVDKAMIEPPIGPARDLQVGFVDTRNEAIQGVYFADLAGAAWFKAAYLAPWNYCRPFTYHKTVGFPVAEQFLRSVIGLDWVMMAHFLAVAVYQRSMEFFDCTQAGGNLLASLDDRYLFNYFPVRNNFRKVQLEPKFESDFYYDIAGAAIEPGTKEGEIVPALGGFSVLDAAEIIDFALFREGQ